MRGVLVARRVAVRGVVNKMPQDEKKPGSAPGFLQIHRRLIYAKGYSAPQRLKTSEPLVPPKPKLLDSA
jgi:hypothetical protein